MFTGIVEATGVVADIEEHAADRRVRIDAGLFAQRAAEVGESVCVSGVCLTSLEKSSSSLLADVSSETLACTTLGALRPGDRVNLERALTPATPLGGHLVSGHVDAIGRVVDRRSEARSVRFEIAAPAELARYIAVKGSICVDGVSLTVNQAQARAFGVNIVPHTLEVTTLGALEPGLEVNLEVDLIARYVERLLEGRGVDGARA
ncbi:MAG: riboflavin synthase [Gammaproteobacteria bacterium]|nr:riboflavin synthase [Gammaproteobacteria bacterium]